MISSGRRPRNAAAIVVMVCAIALTGAARAEVKGWLDWRGPHQNGTSLEKNLPGAWVLGGKNDLWSIPIGGGGTPIIANGKVYVFGYTGEGPDMQEVLYCADAETGKIAWQHRFSDFLSDITYDRYSIGSPTVDPETGNVYVCTSAGIFACFTGDGKPLWQHSLMEALGRLTFTNGRSGGPMIDNDLVIYRYVTSNWGADGPAQDRLYGFDKKTGEMVWSSSPGTAPKDNSFARPWKAWRNGKRVYYTGIGDGSVVCVNGRTGEAIWRYPISAGGLNSSVVVYKNLAIAIHDQENLDSSDSGRMVALRLDAEPQKVEGLPPQLDKSAVAWQNELAATSSSPVLVGNRIYQTNKTGELCCVDADTGKILWRHKLGPDQLHASPLYADGKLYIPIQNGSFFILKPTETGVQELAKLKLEERCIGAPSAYNGKVYVLSTKRLYCFGTKGSNRGTAQPDPKETWPKAGPTVALQVIPAEVLLRPGEKVRFRLRGIDANGLPTEWFDASKAQWEKFVPPTARVRSEISATFSPQGELVADAAQRPSAGAFRATVGGISGTGRGRVLPTLPFKQDFETFQPTESLPTAPDEKFAYPPLPWIGARGKFDVRDLEGNKVFAKTLDNIFFQRATVFFGHPSEKNYTFECDVMTDGNRRLKSTVGVINQRYFIVLDGNAQEMQVMSNAERIRAVVPFKWDPKVWYRLKTRVDIAPDGSGIVRGKAWKKGDPEPEAWTIEVPHKNAHTQGAPGLLGFAPQSLFRVYVDNISVTPNG